MNKIKQLREENNLTQLQLAEILNKKQQTISLYENGTNEPDLDSYIIMSKIFNCSIEYIAGRSNIRTPIDLSKIQFANAGGLNTDGLTERDIEELKAQIEFKRKYNKERKNEGKN